MANETPTLFMGAGKILLSASAGFLLFQVIRDEEDLETAIIYSLIGFCSLQFFDEALEMLNQVAGGLNAFVTGALGGESFAKVIREVFSDFHARSGESSKLGLLADTLRTGVWGIVASLIELCYLVVAKLLTVSAEVLLKLVALLLPLASGLYPLAPGILKNLWIYLIELSLWAPMAALVHGFLAKVTREELTKTPDDLGLSMLIMQIISILLLISIPSLTHQLISGSLSGDGGIGPSGLTGFIRRHTHPLTQFVKRKALGRFGVVLVSLAFIPSLVMAETIDLVQGNSKSVRCRGKLLSASLGAPELIDMAPIPDATGCGVILRPKDSAGLTNIILQTSIGEITADIRIHATRPANFRHSVELEVNR